MMATMATALTAGVLTAGLLLAGCASAARQPALTKRFVRPAPSDTEGAPAPFDAPRPTQDSQAIANRLRELGAQARPNPRQTSGTSLESVDEQLAGALLGLRLIVDRS